MHTAVSRRSAIVILTLFLMASITLITAGRALADHQVCTTNPRTGEVHCWIERNALPGHGGGPGSGKRDGKCREDGTIIPCYLPGNGYWDATHSCYASPMDPQPPLGDQLWGGHTTGTIYRCTGGQGAGFFWSPNSPPGPPPAALLAQRAETMLHVPMLRAGANGGPSRTTYVGIPTWLWINGDWRALVSPPAAVGGRSVTATATPTSVVWSMGDGQTTTCDGPGSQFNSADPNHPPCGYTYRVDSSEEPQTGPSVNDRYFTVRATVTWQINWQCTGSCDQDSGTLPAMQRQATPLPLRVFQVETVVTADHR